MKQPITYYVSGHTAKGSVNFFNENASGIDHVIVLQHNHPQIISMLLKAMMAQQNRDEVEVILDPYGAGTISGVIYRDTAVAFVGESLVMKRLPDIHYTEVDLNTNHSLPVLDLKPDLLEAAYEKAYAAFKLGLEIHDELEAVYVGAMDFHLADEVANDFLHQLFLNQMSAETDRRSKVYKRLFGTNTLSGMENVVAGLLKPIQNRVYVKGRAGTGKSVFMKKVWKACQVRGFDVEVYHCSFDPDSIDMLIVRELDFCMFDSTAPHEFSPTRQGDEVVDLYALTVKAGTDVKYAAEIDRLTKAYKAEMQRGLSYLKEAKAIYPPIPEDTSVQQIVQELKSSGLVE